MNALDSKSRWRFKIHEVIFEADTPAGKWFDVLLILCILVSVVMVMLDSVSAIQKTHGRILIVRRVAFYDFIHYRIRCCDCSALEDHFSLCDQFLRRCRPFSDFTHLSQLSLIPGAQYFLVIRILAGVCEFFAFLNWYSMWARPAC